MQKALEILKKYRGALAVGVSGGVDSMCLLSLILNCGFFDKKQITVLHIDHNLRATSKRDSDLVQKFCAQNGVGVRVFSPDIRAQARKNKRSIETEARLFRHRVFKEFCTQNSCALALAHNADDQAETILMHIFRGAGIGGLVGMGQRDNHIIRPFLHIYRHQIEQYAVQNKIPFFEDETNKDTSYWRNFVRNLFCQIESKYPAAKKNINRLGLLALQNEQYILGELNLDFFRRDGGAVLLDKSALKTPLAARYILKAAEDMGVECDLEFKHIEAVKSLVNKESGKKIDLVHGLVAGVERDFVAFYFKSAKCKDVVEFAEGNNVLGGLIVCAKSVAPKVIRGQIVVDALKLGGAQVRFRREGDRFCPCGGKERKLKEFFNQKRIPNRLKDKIPLIVRGSEVLVVCGVELSDTIKITDSTKNAFKIEVLGEADCGKD